MKNICISFLFIFIQAYTASAQSITLIPSGSSWKYLDNGTDQGKTWRAATFNDNSWLSGNAQFGYGDGDETTLISYGPNSTNKYITTYFRKTFSIPDPTAYSAFTLSVLRDDGVLVYLNGARVALSNMPSSGITYTTLAKTNITGLQEKKYYTFTLNAGLFVSGNNVFAVEIHQVNAANNDISFDLKLEGTPVVSCGTPTQLAASAVTANTASLSWSAVQGALSYQVIYRPLGFSSWSTISSATNNLFLSDLFSFTTYEFEVQAICQVAGSYSAPVNFNTLLGTDTLIKSNYPWKYLDNGSNQGTGWTQSAFNDASWLTGNAELGYGDGGEATVVSFGPNASDKYITTYFRKSFTVVNPANYTSFNMNYVRDDGIVVYLNGNELFRNNMPAGTVSYNTLASTAISGAGESAWNNISLNTAGLIPGNNILAVEIHQQAASNPDISFNARLYASTIPTLVNITRGAYLQQVTPNSITIRWRTDIACNSKVQYGTSIGYGNSLSDAALVTDHQINITGLSPATNYFYAVGTNSQVIQGDVKNNFFTAPVSGSTGPVRVWVTGDFGNGSTQQTAVRNAYQNYTGTTPTNLWLWLGDNAYSNGTDAEYQSYVFTRYPDQLKGFPLYPAPGNHDYANAGYQGTNALTTNFPYYSMFTVPQNAEAGGIASGTPKYYSFNYANIHFISLDSYGALNNAGSPMYNWLNNDLAANSQRWTVVYFHHPPFSKGTHNSDTETELINMRTNIVPLLESYHVDLVLSGHSHTNERSFLIKGHFGAANTFNANMKVSNATNVFTKGSPFDGTIYAVCGTSGQGSTSTSSGYPMACMYFNNNSDFCSLVIDVNGDSLSSKYLSSTGTIIDQFSINKVGIRHEGLQANKEQVFSVYYDNEEIALNYFLAYDATVKVELVNVLGEKIPFITRIPAFQSKGHYHFELSVSEKSLGNGVYFLRLFVNGNMQLKKFLVAD